MSKVVGEGQFWDQVANLHGKPHRKPAPPIVRIVWPARGGTLVQAELPATQVEAQEEAIGLRFARAIAAKGLGFSYAVSDGEPADSLLTDGERTISIQHVEVTDPNRRKIQAIRDSYAAAVTRSLALSATWTTGLHFRIDDYCRIDALHEARSSRSTSIVDRVVGSILENRGRLLGMDADGVHWPFDDAAEHLPLTVRAVPTGARGPAIVTWTRQWNAGKDELAALLVEAISSKVQKHYAVPSNRAFWLTAYGGAGAWYDALSFEAAFEYLASHDHPFDAVFAMCQYTGGAEITMLWPTPSWARLTAEERESEARLGVVELDLLDASIGGVPVSATLGISATATATAS